MNIAYLHQICDGIERGLFVGDGAAFLLVRNSHVYGVGETHASMSYCLPSPSMEGVRKPR